MANNTNATPSPVPAEKADTQTSAGKVSLVMDKSQHMASELVVDGVTLKQGESVEVPKDVAEKLLQRRDENGHRYVAKA